LGGLNSAVSLSCLSPANIGVSCSFSSASIKPGGSATLTVATTGHSGSLEQRRGRNPWKPIYALLLFPAIGLVGIRSLGGRSRKSLVRTLLLGTALLSIAGSHVACGGSGNHGPVTPAGTYTVNIDATANTSLHHSTSVSVIVQ
jgi:hypothetical protein